MYISVQALPGDFGSVQKHSLRGYPAFASGPLLPRRIALAHPDLSAVVAELVDAQR